MAGCNTRVVRRSHALQGYPWGEDFSYAEAMGTGRGARGWLRAQSMRMLLGVLISALAVRWARSLTVGTVLPKPGAGPSASARERGYFAAHMVARSDKKSLRLDVKGDGDPGYLATSRMLAQTALVLANDDLADMYGVLTPGGVMGDALLNRLPRVGIHFQVREDA